MYKSLLLDSDYGIGEDAFAYIISIFSELNPKIILEFGSGASSIRLAQAFPETEIVSIEGRSAYFEETLGLKKQYLSTNNLSIILAELGPRLLSTGLYYSYKLSRHVISGVLDGVIIDGPPHHTMRGREACLQYAYNCLREGGVVVLDDARRQNEKQIVRNWELTYPESFTIDLVDVGHGLAILRKVKHVQPKVFVFERLIDNASMNVQMAHGTLQARLALFAQCRRGT
jgi:predicted O-methyltransferase YrrM